MAATLREFRIPNSNLTLRALEWGGAEPPVVALHATSFCADVWGPLWGFARAAGAEKWRLVAVDQRGHGRSDAPGEPEAYAWTRLAEDVEAVMRALRRESGDGVCPITLLGHSSGASAALAAAGRAPQPLAAVVAVEPVLFDPVPPGVDVDSFAGSRALARRSRRRRARFASLEEARASIRKRFPYSGFDPAALEAYLEGGFEREEDGSLTLRCRPEVEAWAYEGAAALHLWPCVAKIQAPVCLILGEHSAVPARLLERFCSLVHVPKIFRVPGATHFAALERPAEVGEALGHFLAELRGR